MLDRKISIAPMLGWTDRHARFLFRQITRRAYVYSEMLSPEAILQGQAEFYLRYDQDEHPVAYQLGGSNPERLAAASRRLEEVGYDEVNLNVGCPSNKGERCLFGAHLMRHPGLVTECLQAMRAAVSIPVTVKTRIGVDRDDDYAPLSDFVGAVRESGVSVFIIHARKAWLDGLNPKENRDIPPLRYEYVYRLKREFPDLSVILNGGVTEWSEAAAHLRHVDGVMVGRRAYKDPYWLATVDRDFYGCADPPPSRVEVMRRCIPYVERELARGTPLRRITRHMVRFYRNAKAAAAFRRLIALEATHPDAGLDTYLRAVEIVGMDEA